jgi:hypothetical protein
MKTSGTASGSSGSTSSSSNRSRSGSSSSGSGSKTSNSIASGIKDNLSLKPLSASASSNHPLINGNEIAEKDTNKISLSEIGDGVFSFISGAASGVAASLSMGLSDIFVVKDDNKNETVYLVGRLVGAVVVAVVAVAVTAGSTAAAVGTSPTVVGSAVSVGSAVNAGGKVVSAVGVAGDAVSTIIANGSGGSSGAADIAIVDSRKFSDYIFKDGVAPGKDVVYKNLGYSDKDSELLTKIYQEQGAAKYALGNYSFGKLDKYGQRINIEIELQGIGEASGKISYLQSGWMIKPDNKISLNTPFSGFTK